MPIARSNLLSRLARILGAALLLSASSAAQTVMGTISGTVVDQQSQVVPGATLTVINEATGETRSAVSAAAGDVLVTNLQPGLYTLRIVLQGFRTLERKNIVLSAGERLAVAKLTLQTGKVGEKITRAT